MTQTRATERPRMGGRILCVLPEDRCLGLLVAAHLRREVPHLKIRSAAPGGLELAPPHPNALLVGLSQGMNLWGQRSHRLDDSLCDWADLILVWSTDDLSRLQQQWPGRRHRIQALDPAGWLAPWSPACDEADLRARLPAIEALVSLWARRLDATSPTQQN